MKRKNIDTMREVRLWIGQIIVPAVTVVGSALAIPEVRQAVATKANQWKESVEKKIKKDKKEKFEVLKQGPLFFLTFYIPYVGDNKQ